MKPTGPVARRCDYEVRDVPLLDASRLIRAEHYAGGCSNTVRTEGRMIGTSVVISSDCSLDGRTGIVTETPPFWTAQGWHRVEFDPVNGRASWGILPASELRPFVRPAQVGQLGLWGVA